MQCVLGVMALAAGVFFAVMVANGVAAEAKAPAGNPVVLLETNHGSISIELYPDKAPVSVQNFLAYVDAGFYNGTIFHRVIPKFMLQAGGFTKDMQQKPAKPPIKNEADNGLRNSRGTIAMARTQDINSATSQFFINIADNSFLDHGVRDFGYAVFGKVTAGMEAVDKIAAVRTGTAGMHQDVPLEPVIISSARRK